MVSDIYFIDPSEITTKYTVTDIGHLSSFNAYTQDYVESQTQHYACAVSALMVCASFLDVLIGMILEGTI